MNQVVPVQTIVRGDLFQECCDHIFWNNTHPRANPHFEAGSVVFCKIDAVLSLFEQLRLTRKRIILVTGEGDFPCDAFRQKFLPKNVVHWYSTNVTHAHPRVSAIPLGLGTPYDPVTLKAPELLAAQKKEALKNQWLYVGFRPETNRDVRQKIYDYFQQRSQQESWITFDPPLARIFHIDSSRGASNPDADKEDDGFRRRLYVSYRPRRNSSPTQYPSGVRKPQQNRYEIFRLAGSNISRELFLTEFMRHHFILCPPGNGVDTHRLWETLTAGSYPIVLKSEAMKPFEALPILFVDDVEEIALNFLQENVPQLETKKKNLFMLEMPFWENKIQDAKKELLGQERMPWSEWIQESFRYSLGMIQRRIFS